MKILLTLVHIVCISIISVSNPSDNKSQKHLQLHNMFFNERSSIHSLTYGFTAGKNRFNFGPTFNTPFRQHLNKHIYGYGGQMQYSRMLNLFENDVQVEVITSLINVTRQYKTQWVHYNHRYSNLEKNWADGDAITTSTIHNTTMFLTGIGTEFGHAKRLTFLLTINTGIIYSLNRKHTKNLNNGKQGEVIYYHSIELDHKVALGINFKI